MNDLHLLRIFVTEGTPSLQRMRAVYSDSEIRRHNPNCVLADL